MKIIKNISQIYIYEGQKFQSKRVATTLEKIEVSIVTLILMGIYQLLNSKNFIWIIVKHVFWKIKILNISE